eukprot:gnl/TRDRNA2_/TRDRNA2_86024_c0_seq1.p2 gnl/TRDRNA2_/TRDRNA2_86024_c0~~gnl/TRDRNA2_/TRDRNA2_86024_c0_seq1.p2  ORF type:complete len:131 (+),score=24.84 gnl/TRDRNA2_/TRDRNA2_86024_c0_seq1:23-394(+)
MQNKLVDRAIKVFKNDHHVNHAGLDRTALAKGQVIDDRRHPSARAFDPSLGKGKLIDERWHPSLRVLDPLKLKLHDPAFREDCKGVAALAMVSCGFATMSFADEILPKTGYERVSASQAQHIN